MREVCRAEINASLSPEKLGVKTQEVELCSGVKSTMLETNFRVCQRKLLPEAALCLRGLPCGAPSCQRGRQLPLGESALNLPHTAVTELLIVF